MLADCPARVAPRAAAVPIKAVQTNAPARISYNVLAKPDARRQARVPKAKARSAAAGFACYAPSLLFRFVANSGNTSIQIARVRLGKPVLGLSSQDTELAEVRDPRRVAAKPLSKRGRGSGLFKWVQEER